MAYTDAPFDATSPGHGVDQPKAVGWGVALAAALAGGMHALALSPMVAGLFASAPAMLQSLALAWLLVLLAPARASKQAAFLTWLYGTTWLVGATGWMYVSLHQYGGLPAWMAAMAVLALCAMLSLYMALLGWMWALGRHGAWARDALAFAGLWLLAEWARAIVLTGFPWGGSGYGLVNTPLSKLAPWVGVYGMGAVWAGLMAMLVWSAWGSRTVAERSAAWLGTLGLLGALALAPTPQYTHQHGMPLTVTLLQGNVPQDEKFVSERQMPMLIWYAQQLLAARTTLVVAPETAIPLLPSQLPPGYLDQVQAGFARGTGKAALIGVPLGDPTQGYTNSVVGLGRVGPQTRQDDGSVYQYNKHHLVPFGEFIPWGFHWFVNMMNMPLGDFNRGPVMAPSFAVQDQRVAPTICYEDLFGEDIAARFIDADKAPTLLANVSNLAWFGQSVAIFQHLQIARMRSLEFQLPTLRATNTGATVVIDPMGRVQSALPTHTRGALTSTVQGYAGVTPYAWWAGRWGLWPLMLLGLGAVLLGRKRRATRI